MLQKLVLRNFQAHKKLELELDPHVTTIIGSSDVGKSAIIRALYWLTFNKPSGEAFRKHGTKSTSVDLTVDDQLIKRKRGKSNHYYLGGSPLSAFGTGVPDEISQLLRMSEINFQRQHDGPFWFTESPGQVAKNLNSIVDLGIIDSVTASVASKTRRASSTVEVCESRLADAKARTRSLQWVLRCDSELQLIEQQETDLTKAGQYIGELQFLLGEVTKHRTVLKKAVEVKERGSILVEVGDKVRRLESQRTALVELLEQINSLRGVVSSCQVEAEKVRQEIMQGTAGQCPICRGPLKMGL